MAKKDHSSAFDKVLEQGKTKKKAVKAVKKDVQPETIIRTTLMLSQEIKDKIDAIAYWERKDKTEVIKEALTARIKKYERNHDGKIQPIPKKTGSN